MEQIIIRAASMDDYPSFRRMEEKAWAGTPIPPISEEMFAVWLDVHPDGLRLAVIGDEVVAHNYTQICHFDPYDPCDNRDLDTITDRMYTKNTHDPSGNCVYGFSISGTHGGAMKKLNDYFVDLATRLNKQYYLGVVRMAGLDEYGRRKGITVFDLAVVNGYARGILETVRGQRRGADRILDPVVTPLIFVRRNLTDIPRVIERFFPDPPFCGSQSWGCLILCPTANGNRIHV
jgi:hypothetical protein